MSRLARKKTDINLWKAGATHPDRPAIISPEFTLSYRQLVKFTLSTARCLEDHHFQGGEYIAIQAPNCPHYLLFLLACWKLKIVPVLLSTRWPADYTTRNLEAIGCKRLILSRECPGDEIPGVTVCLLDDLVKISDQPDSRRMTRSGSLDPDQPATVMFTSGSSGFPKAVLHTIGNHYYNALGSQHNIPVNPGDRWLLSLPLYHVGGLAVFWRILQGGGAVVIPPPGATLSAAIREFRITHISLVATQLYRLLQQKGAAKNLRKMKAILLGGGPIPATLLQKAADLKLPVYVSYGCTEMASQITTTAGEDPPYRWFTAGRALPFREVKIVADGEILVKGETLFRGYVTGRGLERPLDREGWFPTGDVGRLDEGGYLTVMGRKDNMFISGGENIQPEEIEARIRDVAGVEEVVVVPVPHPEYGQRPVAVIKIQEDRKYKVKEKSLPGRRTGQKKKACLTAEQHKIPDKKYKIEQVRKYLRKVLPGYKVPDHFLPWPEEDAAGLKISRVEFREWAEKMMKGGKRTEV